MTMKQAYEYSVFGGLIVIMFVVFGMALFGSKDPKPNPDKEACEAKGGEWKSKRKGFHNYGCYKEMT